MATRRDNMYMEDSLAEPLASVLLQMQYRIDKATYFGVPCLKSPTDFWQYQELITALAPDVIVEVGSWRGGSALAMAHLCDALGKGRIISVDIEDNIYPLARAHPRITFLHGDACEKFEAVKALCAGAQTVLVIEDSSHLYQQTLDVLNAYSSLVTLGSYLIVEDGIIHHGLEMEARFDPFAAVATFIAHTTEFETDRTKEGFVITWNPTGYLKRIANGPGQTA